MKRLFIGIFPAVAILSAVGYVASHPKEAVKPCECLALKTTGTAADDCHNTRCPAVAITGLSRPTLNLRGAVLEYGVLTNVNFSSVDLSRSECSFITLNGVDLSKANCAGAFMKYARITSCSFSNANLSSAALAHGAIRTCDFSHADLTAIDLNGTTVDHATKWPHGFDPVRHGAIYTGGHKTISDK